jgi:hypothetical protein
MMAKEHDWSAIVTGCCLVLASAVAVVILITGSKPSTSWIASLFLIPILGGGELGVWFVLSGWRDWR